MSLKCADGADKLFPQRTQRDSAGSAVQAPSPRRCWRRSLPGQYQRLSRQQHQKGSGSYTAALPQAMENLSAVRLLCIHLRDNPIVLDVEGV
jgi:hypothetical protein